MEDYRLRWGGRYLEQRGSAARVPRPPEGAGRGALQALVLYREGGWLSYNPHRKIIETIHLITPMRVDCQSGQSFKTCVRSPPCTCFDFRQILALSVCDKQHSAFEDGQPLVEPNLDPKVSMFTKSVSLGLVRSDCALIFNSQFGIFDALRRRPSWHM